MPQSTQTTRASKLGLHVALDKRAPHLSWCQWVTPLCLLEDIKSSLGILFGEFICRSYSIDETQMCILKVKLNLSSVVSPSVSYFLCVCVKKSQHVWYFHTSQVWSYTNIGSLVTDSRSANKRLHRTKAGCGGRITTGLTPAQPQSHRSQWQIKPSVSFKCHLQIQYFQPLIAVNTNTHTYINILICIITPLNQMTDGKSFYSAVFSRNQAGLMRAGSPHTDPNVTSVWKK